MATNKDLVQIRTDNQVTTLAATAVFYVVPDWGTPVDAAIDYDDLVTQISTDVSGLTASNVGAGDANIFKQKTAGDLEFRTVSGGTGITVTEGASVVTVALTASATDVAVDLSNNAVDDIAALIRINTTGDTNSVITESPTNELLIDMGVDWLRADALDVANLTELAVNPLGDTDHYVIDDGGTTKKIKPNNTHTSSVRRTITQTSHGLGVGDPIYETLTGYAQADATTEVKAKVLGLVSSVPDANTFELCTEGYMTGLSGKTAGQIYYLSETTGAITATKPTTGHVVEVFVADSATSGWVKIKNDPTDINALVEVTAIDGASDMVSLYDTSASRWKKGLVNNLLALVSGAAQNLTPTAIKSANYTAATGDLVRCDANAAAGDFTITLPAYPSLGDRVGVCLTRQHVTRIVDISSSANINGAATFDEWRLVIFGDFLIFTYLADGIGWAVQDGIRPHYATLARSVTAQTIAAGGVQLAFDTADADNADLTTPDIKLITVRRAGRYSFKCSGGWAISAGAPTWVHMQLREDPVTLLRKSVVPAANSVFYPQISWEANVSSGTNYSIYMDCTAATSIINGTSEDDKPRFFMHEIRPNGGT
jgi:hypothetical protein